MVSQDLLFRYVLHSLQELLLVVLLTLFLRRHILLLQLVLHIVVRFVEIFGSCLRHGAAGSPTSLVGELERALG